eukprot:TRINITY_DN27168_c0_g2_i1.p1 TRINITY_DN27168_c0_g2~~TRINITY_DN27168_c0_g2_i1.p1  ORF type:complete len:603 (+),score=77.49 TRINITY_DN27168_c0_g2_i1:60-1868(+)
MMTCHWRTSAVPPRLNRKLTSSSERPVRRRGLTAPRVTSASGTTDGTSCLVVRREGADSRSETGRASKFVLRPAARTAETNAKVEPVQLVPKVDSSDVISAAKLCHPEQLDRTPQIEQCNVAEIETGMEGLETDRPRTFPQNMQQSAAQSNGSEPAQLHSTEKTTGRQQTLPPTLPGLQAARSSTSLPKATPIHCINTPHRPHRVDPCPAGLLCQDSPASSTLQRSPKSIKASRSLPERNEISVIDPVVDPDNQTLAASLTGLPLVPRTSKLQKPSRSLPEPRNSEAMMLLAQQDLLSYWELTRSQTRNAALEAMLKRRGVRRHWELGAGEGLDWLHIRNVRYARFVPLCRNSAMEVSADSCIQWLSRQTPAVRVLDLGCGVGAFLARLKSDGTNIDWSASFGVTSVHSSDIEMFQPPKGHPDFFTEHLRRFDLDSLAENVYNELQGQRFDFISSHYCFCHLKDPLGALCVSFELLRPGGLLLLIEPQHASTGSLPYSDHNNYHWLSENVAKPVQLHNHMLPHWANQGVQIFSSCQRSMPQEHVLVLRKTHGQVRLTLPRELQPGGPGSMDFSSLLQARSDDLKRPFMIPEACSFQEWLASS